jgi:hypothetical protein
METTKNQEECCPKFESAPWEEKIFEWDKKKFIKDKVCTLFYMPLNFGSVMRRVDKLLRAENATTPEYMCLSDHTSKWNMDIYIGVDKLVTGAQNVEISGKFYSRVYEGNFNKTGEWCKDFEAKAKEKGLEIKKWYMWYTTCPKCAKKYGKNYVVIVCEV